MKAAIISKSDAQGGAYIAAYRLHDGLKKSGIDSVMVVDHKITDKPGVYGPTSEISRWRSKIRSSADKLPSRLHNWQNTDFHPGWVGRDLADNELLKDADVINLHFFLSGFLSVRGMAKLARLEKPIVWTLHDMWAFTGGCHYAGSCERYKTRCGACSQLRSDKSKDLSYRIFKKKSKYYSDLNISIVVLCNWMLGCVKHSSLLSRKPVHLIPNGLDSDVFKPIEKLTARNILNLPLDRKIILSGALGVTSSKRKGFEYLRPAIEILANTHCFRREELCMVIFGASHSNDMGNSAFEVRFLGRLYDEPSLALAYSAADVFVAPSIEENLSNTVMESLSCGTPVVAFDIGGMPDMIEHQVNGYLAERENVDSLAAGITWVIQDDNRGSILRKAAREKALREYTLDIQAGRYRSLFASLM